MNCVRLMILVVASAASCANAHDWTHHARGPQRVAVSDIVLTSGFGSPVWVRGQTDPGAMIEFVGHSSLVATEDCVIATGWIGADFAAIAMEHEDGRIRWIAPMPQPVADSWSAPAIDTVRGTVIVASGRVIRAFWLDTGTLAWQADTTNDIINASPLVVSRAGLPHRVFMTDFGFGGQPGRLYAINVDDFDAALNPYQIGQIVWSRVIGQLSGATPAFYEDRVIVAAGDGRVLAFDAAATASHDPVWEAINPTGLGFFGGVSVRDGFVYAASYAFFGGVSSANMIKIDATTGAVVWSVPSNRTDAMPVPLAQGLIVLSGGISGFGSQPSLSLYRDHGASATRLWDTHLDSGPSVGFWTFTPVVLESMGQVLAPVPPSLQDPLGPMHRTLRLDLGRTPVEAGFIVETIEGAGLSTAGGRFFGIGPDGVMAFEPQQSTCLGDFNGDGTADFFDIVAFLAAFSAQNPSADVNQDGLFDFFDIQLFLMWFAAGCDHLLLGETR